LTIFSNLLYILMLIWQRQALISAIH